MFYYKVDSCVDSKLSCANVLCIGHMLGVAASWLVQVGVRIFQFFTSKSRNEDATIDRAERIRVLRQKIFIATVRCQSSLIFAAIGGGIGATLFRPEVGQWIGKIMNNMYAIQAQSHCHYLLL